jgi:Na+-transporting methylmalonyl-CoA/oxaloacetate decarboxylase gamma subunit
MSTTDPPRPAGPTGAPAHSQPPSPPLSRLVGRRPNQGATVAAKVVVEDVRSLVRAEIQLAKAEIAEGVKAKAMGAGLFIVVAIIGWLALQVFLVFLGFLFALFLPGWAAVGLVLLLLVLLMAGLGFLGYRKMKVRASLDATKRTVEESKAATQAAVDKAKADTQSGIEEAKVTVRETADDVKQRVGARLGQQHEAGR